MPPPLPDSDADSVTVEPTKASKEEQQEVQDTMMDEADVKGRKDDDEDENEDEDDDAETFVVEKLLDHRSDFEDNQLRYLVKWKGYEKKADRTWESEENLEGARDILEGYWKTLGGKPIVGSEQKPKKRGRQSTGTPSSTKTKAKDAKKPRLSKGGRKSNGPVEQDVDISDLSFTQHGDDDWKPPPAKDGSWDALVQSVDTVVRENADGELWGYLIWNEKSEAGRFYRSKAKLPVIYKACPQRMLHFYEKHLVFTTAADTDPNTTDDNKAST